MSVSPIPLLDVIWTIAPETIAPAIAPRNAPTIPPQNRSGTNTVKCHSAIPIVSHTSAAISSSPRSSGPPVLSLAATALLLPPLLDPLHRGRARLAQLGLLLRRPIVGVGSIASIA